VTRVGTLVFFLCLAFATLRLGLTHTTDRDRRSHHKKTKQSVLRGADILGSGERRVEDIMDMGGSYGRGQDPAMEAAKEERR
jgi:hypothetical protein